MSRFLWRGCRYGLIFSGLLLLFSFLTLAFIFYTPAGLKLTLWGAEKFIPSLTVGQVQGTIGQSFILNHVSYTDPRTTMLIRLDHVSASLNSRCFLQPALCVDDISVDGVEVQLPEEKPGYDSKKDESPLSHQDIILPIPVSVARLQLNHVRVRTPQADVRWKEFSGGASFRKGQLVFSPVRWHQIDVTLLTPPPTAGTQAKQPLSVPQDISLPEIWIPLNIFLPDFRLSALTLHQSKPQYIEALNVAVSAHHHRVVVTHLGVKAPKLDVQMKGVIHLSGKYPLDFQVDSVLEVPPFTERQEVSLRTTGSLQNLKTNIVLDGQIKARAEARLAPLSVTKQFPFYLRADSFSGHWPGANGMIYQLALKQFEMQGNTDSYQLQADGHVHGDSIPDTHVVVSGQGGRTHFNFVQLKLGMLNGWLTGHSEVSWKQGISIMAGLELTHIEPQVQWPDYPGQIDGNVNIGASLSGSDWRVSLSKMDIVGRLKQYPLDITGKIQASGNTKKQHTQLNVSSLKISHGPNYLMAEGKLDQQWKMKVAVAVPDLSKSVSGLSGQFQGDIHLAGQMTAPDIGVKLTGKNIRWQDQFRMGQLQIQGQVQPSPDIRGDIHVLMKDGQYQQEKMKRIQLHLAGNQKHHRATLKLDTSRGAGELELIGSASETWQKWHGKLKEMRISVGQNPLVLEKATEIDFDTHLKAVMVQAHCWLSESARLCLDKKAVVRSDAGRLQLSLKNFRLHQLANFLPSGITMESQVNGQASVYWQHGQSPDVDAKVVLTPGTFRIPAPTPVEIQWQDFGLQLHIKDHRLSLNSQLNLSQNGNIDLHLELPDILKTRERMQGMLTVRQVSLEFLKGLLGEYSDFHTVVNTQIKFQGAMLHPQLYGKLTLSEMQVKGQMTPVDIRQGSIRIDLNGYQADWNAHVNTPEGILNLEGSGDWKSLKAWKVRSHLYADAVQINVPPMVWLKATPDIKLVMTPESASVSGKIILPEGRITIDKLPAGAVKVSDDQVILDASGHPIQQRKTLPFRLNTHITVELGDRVSLAAFGLKGRLRGKLNVSQQGQVPFINGEVNILDGKYRSFGQDLLITQGKVLMNGPVDQPYVSITAIRNPEQIEDDVTAGIQVTGPADNPVVSVFSEPSMPQANALSYLLRGKNLTTDAEGNAVTTSLIGLTLAQSGQLVGELGQAFGVQELEMDTKGSGDETQVTVSGYILPGLQVKYGVGIFNSVGEFTVRYRLMRNLYLEAISGLTSTVDLLYQFEFN